MMNVDTATAVAILIAAITSAVVSVMNAWFGRKAAKQVAAVHREVATSNGHTLAQIVEANATVDSHDPDPSPKLEP